MDIFERPRRLRRTPGIRALMQETHVSTDDLVQPLFVIPAGGPEPISSLPGQYRFSPDHLVAEVRELLRLGIRAVALFPALPAKLKSPQGKEALNKDTLILKTIRLLKRSVPEMTIIADIALDPYTTHGHDGVLKADGSDVDNDATVEILSKMAVLHAEAGVDFVAPSDMMDGRIAAVRLALDNEGWTETGIIAYSAKFNSAYYGPFRTAVGSASAAGTTLLGKDTYQLNPANRREAIRELELDAIEGADMLMVKPAGPYLDIIHQASEMGNLPIAAYQVSGEYAQLHAAAQLGWLDLQRCRNESLLAIKRAGADVILTYFAKAFAEDFVASQKEAKSDPNPHQSGGGI